MKHHLFAHNDKQFVKVGDTVEAYTTKIATIGTGNGQFYAHLHHSVSEELSIESQLKYVIGWAKSQVQQYYRNPTQEGVDYNKMFETRVDIGNAGYSWLQPLLAPQKGFHPGIDVNGIGGGNTDVGMAFTSPINGKVVYSYNGTGKNGGWGKLLIIEEQESMKTPEKLIDEVGKYNKILNTKVKLSENITSKNLDDIKDLMSMMRDACENYASILAEEQKKIVELQKKVENQDAIFEVNMDILNDQKEALREKDQEIEILQKSADFFERQYKEFEKQLEGMTLLKNSLEAENEKLSKQTFESMTIVDLLKEIWKKMK